MVSLGFLQSAPITAVQIGDMSRRSPPFFLVIVIRRQAIIRLVIGDRRQPQRDTRPE